MPPVCVVCVKAGKGLADVSRECQRIHRRLMVSCSDRCQPATVGTRETLLARYLRKNFPSKTTNL